MNDAAERARLAPAHASTAPVPAGPPAPPGTGAGASVTAASLRRRAAVFLPAAVPRQGRIAFWSPDGEPWPDGPGGPAGPGGPEPLTVVRPHGAAGVRSRDVAAVVLDLGAALPVLAAAPQDPAAHPATRCWGTAARQALALAARGRLLPGLTPEGYDAWRAGPLDAEDVAHLRAVAAALPYEGYATPLPGRRPLHLPEPEALVRAFLDAVADTLPRTPAAPVAAGRPFAAAEPQQVPGIRDWAAQVAAGSDAGVGISLRLDLSSYQLFDAPDPEEEDTRRAGAAVVQVHSLADPTLVTDAGQLWAGTAAAGFGPRARIDAVLALRRAARAWPPLLRLLDQPVPDLLALSDPELEDLLGVAATRLAAAGVVVHWPRELARTLTATAVVRSAAPGSATDGTAFFDAAGLFSFSWELALGGDRLTPGEMDALAQAHRPVVRLRDQWVRVDPELVRKARRRELGLLDPVDALAVALGGTAEVPGEPEPVPAVPVGALAALRDRLTGELAPLPHPPGLKATLRDYQLRGLAWLDRMTSLGLGGCLADDMGLGKTVTLIALHLHRDHPAPTLVICPASLLGNWQREIEKFAPGVPVRRYHGAGRTLSGLTGGFVLTTYGTMRAGAARLADQSWGMVVADEAQHIKNPHSATARALRTIPAPARVALTGTPVENNLSELWALLDWTTPGLLGPLTAFRARHARAVEQQQQEDGGNEEAVARLAALVRPFLLRRRKSDPGIAPELPPKTETDHPVSLTREQASLYQAAVDEAMAVIETSEGMERRGMIMKLLASLKQICNHPAQFLKEERPRIPHRSGKLA
ncbi:DEAD/DEAH box helicase, partial [Streptomyces sp. NPDC048603]|uniref:DEAD/DEAH box helicase n=1 Tax=Streptomyces sp. NPDC048603 TaxID=3365577 RepID=UPI003710C6FF